MINIEYPESLANSLKLSSTEFEYEIKASALIKLHGLGRLSSGMAAKVPGISRIDFLDLLSKYNVSYIGTSGLEDLKEDARNA